MFDEMEPPKLTHSAWHQRGGLLCGGPWRVSIRKGAHRIVSFFWVVFENTMCVHPLNLAGRERQCRHGRRGVHAPGSRGSDGRGLAAARRRWGIYFCGAATRTNVPCCNSTARQTKIVPSPLNETAIAPFSLPPSSLPRLTKSRPARHVVMPAALQDTDSATTG